jgi:2-polyprenyl-6-methoxyphenol hydroxylase-like FAD-dependent oxidoreductase
MNALSNTETDVIIIGAGPAGLCFARALSGKGLHITVIEQVKQEQLSNPAFDGREIALTQHSAKLLRDLDIWNRIEPNALSPLRDAKVLNGSNPFSMTISHSLSGQSELGWLVSNHLIRKAAYESLQVAITQYKDIELLCGDKSAACTPIAKAQTLLCLVEPSWRANWWWRLTADFLNHAVPLALVRT